MNSLRIRVRHILLFACFLLPSTLFSQMFTPQIDVSFGGGLNVSYFDIGSGSPGYSLWNSTLYQWSEHWKAGYKLGMHHVTGTDEGTDNFVLGLAYRGNLYEFSGRVEYILYFASSWKSIWKQKINPMLPFGGTWKRKIKPFLYAGAGILQYVPYAYYYATGVGAVENGGDAYVTSVVNGGFGIYYYVNRYFSMTLEAGSNFPFFDYMGDYLDEEHTNSMDMFHTVSFRITWTQPVE